MATRKEEAPGATGSLNVGREGTVCGKDRPSDQLDSLLARLTELSPAEQEALAQAILEATDRIESAGIQSIWETDVEPVSYWVLLLSGVDDQRENTIAQQILLWRDFSAGMGARVRCVRSRERRAFRLCTRHFETVVAPTLVFGLDPTLSSFIRFDPGLLLKLSAQPSALSGLLMRLHESVENGQDLATISRDLRREQFWEVLKVAYGEIKDLLSISISTSG